jgi:uncharacterized RDD family membrane protein YckC
MTHAGPGGLEVAPLWRRLCAGVIDVAVLGVPILAVFLGARAVYGRYRSRAGGTLDSLARFSVSGRWKAAIWMASAVTEVALRNWRAPGYRALGLRRVDAQTGGPIAVRSALESYLLGRATWQLAAWTARPWQTRMKERHELARAEVNEVRRLHEDDEEAQQAVREVYKRYGVNPLGGCAPFILAGALMHAPALWSPLHQTLGDRASGTVVVRE